jgi:DNA mismatch endonuclease (patch repair protein)
MTDTFSPKQRSDVMSRIRSDNTTPEKTVRSFLYLHGFRFRLHQKNLPGKPDIVLKRYKTAIFVHGCFWHQCPLCKSGRLPKSNLLYWETKMQKNKERDYKNSEALGKLGWQVLVVWECQINDEELAQLLLQKLS